jgi:hypothetical protein
MHKKLVQDVAVVLFAHFWSIALANRLVGIVVYAALPHSIITSTVVSGVAFALAYVCAWLLFNKWSTKLWLKAASAAGIFLVLFAVGGLIDAVAVMNMPHPK